MSKRIAKQSDGGAELKRRDFIRRAGKTATAAAVTTVLVANAKPKEARAQYFPSFPDFPDFPDFPN